MPKTNQVLDPRDRLLNQGAGSLSDEEVLAVLLRNGGSGSAAMGAAREILGSASGFRGLTPERSDSGESAESRSRRFSLRSSLRDGLRRPKYRGGPFSIIRRWSLSTSCCGTAWRCRRCSVRSSSMARTA